MVWKKLIFNLFYFRMCVVVLKEAILTVSTLGRCGSLERSNLTVSILGGCGGLEITHF